MLFSLEVVATILKMVVNFLEDVLNLTYKNKKCGL